MEQKICKVNYYSLLVCILVLPLGMLIKYTSLYFNLNSIYLNINLLRLYWFIFPIQGFIYIYCLYKRVIKPNYWDCIMYSLILVGIISSLFAMSYYTSIFGYVKRYEGLIAILSYYLLFLNSRMLDKKSINKLLNILIYVGIFNCLYAILQVIFKAPFVMKFKWFWMASGLNINPNFFGSFMCTIGLISICMYLFNDRRKFFYLIASIIMMIGLVLAQSTGPMIGYFFGIFILLIVLFKRKIKIWKDVFKIGVALFITFLICVYGTDYLFNNIYKYEDTDSYTIKGDIDKIVIYGCDLVNLDCDFTKGNTHLSNVDNITVDNIASNRFTIWKDSLPIIKDNWLVGVGLDNFGLAYEKYYGDKTTDKVHNVYLQILVTNGIIGFIPYMIWLIMIFIYGFKIKNDEMLILLIPFIGYAFQAIFNISVVDVAPIFYILGGMIVGFKEE